MCNPDMSKEEHLYWEEQAEEVNECVDCDGEGCPECRPDLYPYPEPPLDIQ